MAYRIGRTFVDMFLACQVVVGRDIRLSSEALAAAAARGITDAGADVVDIGLCGTEHVYFATFHLGVDGGIMVTASHNPMDYNGLKLVRKGSQPISGDSGLKEMEDRVVSGQLEALAGNKGLVTCQDVMEDYMKHLLTYIDASKLKHLKVVVNAGNGCAGPVIDALAEAFLRSHPGAKIIHDPRLTWNTIELVEQSGGTPILTMTGHAFIKERMRLEDAVYGDEMSAHHYFKKQKFCECGNYPRAGYCGKTIYIDLHWGSPIM
jgi:phosphomannomutase